MDPTANLAEQLEIANRLSDCGYDTDYGPDANPELEADAQRLAQLVQDLNRWIAGGGFLPDQWRRS